MLVSPPDTGDSPTGGDSLQPAPAHQDQKLRSELMSAGHQLVAGMVRYLTPGYRSYVRHKSAVSSSPGGTVSAVIVTPIRRAGALTE